MLPCLDLVSKLALNVGVGDLVCLQGDVERQAGLGLITKVRRGSEDLMDLFEGIDWFVGKPMICVLWPKAKEYPIWMEAEEVALVRSVGISVTII